MSFLPNEESVTPCECMHEKEGECEKSRAPSQTIVVACLTMATICALPRNEGSSAMIAAGGSLFSGCQHGKPTRIPNSLCPTDAGSFHAISALFQKSAQVALADFDETTSKCSFVYITHTHAQN